MPLSERASEPYVPVGGVTKRDGCTWARNLCAFVLLRFSDITLEEVLVFQRVSDS